jgi:mannose-6-phosphate isomerase-like protein (cupin superfamily)
MMSMSRRALAILLLVTGAALAQTGAPATSLGGVKTKAEIDALVARIRSGELQGPQTLFERENGPYRIYTSYIDARKGAADIHVADDEIFLIVSGSAQFTLGGDLVDKKLARENEYRGTVIAGGVTRPVATGDIASAPRGTPHQMDPGSGHVLYIVIKVIGQK